jgi:hypothetical protein
LGDKLPPNTQWLCLGHDYGRKLSLSVVAELTCLTYLDMNIDEMTAQDLEVLQTVTTLQASISFWQVG